ncbi:MAG TPA: glycosyltransferase family 87 protein [Terriglobales bacterium]
MPHQLATAIEYDIPRGNLSDLYPRWLGAKELLLHKRDPYSREVTREIQTGYYGRPLDPARPHDPEDQQGFAYPLYVVFLLAPIITLPFSTVQTGFHWLLIIVSAGTLLVWFKALRWRAGLLTIVVAEIIIFGSFPVVQGVTLRQLSLLVAGFLALGFLALVQRKFVLAGVILAIATVKPQLVILFVSWLALWAVSRWHRRKNVVLSFVIGTALLFASAEWVLHGWIGKFYYAILAYWQYTHAMTPSDVLFGPVVGKLVNILLILAAGAVCWNMRGKEETSIEFSFVSCFVLAATVAIMPIFAPYNQVLLFPGFLFVVQHREGLSPSRYWQKVLLCLAILLIVWQWIACVALTAVYSFVPKNIVESMWRVPFYVSFPLPIIVMCLLYVCAASKSAKALKAA